MYEVAPEAVRLADPPGHTLSEVTATVGIATTVMVLVWLDDPMPFTAWSVTVYTPGIE